MLQAPTPYSPLSSAEMAALRQNARESTRLLVSSQDCCARSRELLAATRERMLRSLLTALLPEVARQ